MIVRLLTWVWLTALWVALWGQMTTGNVLGGMLAGGALLLAFPVRDNLPGRMHFRPVHVLRLLCVLAWQVLVANLVVTREILTPGSKEVNEGIVAVPVTDASPVVLSVLVGMLSLTPGTLIVELRREPNVLYVHVFHLHSVEAVRLDVMRNERVVLRAIGTLKCLRDVERRIAELEQRDGQEVNR